MRDPAPAPELVQSIWRVGDGERLHQAPNVRCAAIGARTIEVLGAPVNGLHKDKMGEFRMISATEVNGKPVYEKEPAVSHMVWASNGYWYVGKRDELGKQAGWMQVCTICFLIAPGGRGCGGGSCCMHLPPFSMPLC